MAIAGNGAAPVSRIAAQGSAASVDLGVLDGAASAAQAVAGAAALEPGLALPAGAGSASTSASMEGATARPSGDTVSCTGSASPSPIDVDRHAVARSEMLELDLRFGLSAYDAAYLELAQRRQCRLTTQDAALRDAALASGVGWLGSVGG